MELPNVRHMTSVHKAFDNRTRNKECRARLQAGYRVTLFVTHDEDLERDGVNVRSIQRPKTGLSRVVQTHSMLLRRTIVVDGDVRPHVGPVDPTGGVR